jgi:hypothetical protein
VGVGDRGDAMEMFVGVVEEKKEDCDSESLDEVSDGDLFPQFSQFAHVTSLQ